MSNRFTLGMLLAAVLAAADFRAAGAQVTTEDPASVLVFPKVIADGSRETFIQISNASNSRVQAICTYVDAQLQFPGQPPGPANPPLWQTIEFDIVLTAQQPTNWLVSAGRPPDPTPDNCHNSPPFFDCYGSGLDPGRVPSVPAGFTGELICVEVDTVLDPISGNHLTGEATLADLSTGDFAKYGAIGLEGFDSNNGDHDLVLGEEYAGCPETWIVQHATENSEVPAAGAGSAFRTELTVALCDLDFLNQIPAAAILQLRATDEYESAYSTSQSIQCWRNSTLGAINSIFEVLPTPTAQTTIRSAVTSDSGILVVAEEFRSTAGPDGAVASAAGNAFAEGVRVDPDLIRLP